MTQLDNVWFQSDLLTVGTFHCPVTYPFFENTGPTNGYTLVFPRTSVGICHKGRAPVVATPNVVMFYNKGQLYTRRRLSQRGDVCDWFAFAPTAVLQAVQAFDPAVEAQPERPFRFTHGPGRPDVYLQQRRLLQYLQTAAAVDTLYVEEAMLRVLHTVVAGTYQTFTQAGVDHRAKTEREHRDLVYAVKELLATRFQESLKLEEIAHAVHSSPYHLSRVFHHYTGVTIHNYLNRLRLCVALEYLGQPHDDLATIALSLGYASHSHFSQAFRRTFGATPTQWRRRASSQMSKILTV